MFYKGLFNKIVKENKVVDFMNMKQDDIIIAQYEARFNELSRFDENMVIKDSNNVIKFFMGLWGDIWVQLMYQSVWTYTATIFAAYMI